MLDVAVDLNREGFFVGRVVAEVVSKDNFFAQLVLDGIIILPHVQKHALHAGCGMYWHVLYHLQELVVILDGDMPARDVCVELLQTEAH